MKGFVIATIYAAAFVGIAGLVGFWPAVFLTLVAMIIFCFHLLGKEGDLAEKLLRDVDGAMQAAAFWKLMAEALQAGVAGDEDTANAKLAEAIRLPIYEEVLADEMQQDLDSWVHARPEDIGEA